MRRFNFTAIHTHNRTGRTHGLYYYYAQMYCMRDDILDAVGHMLTPKLQQLADYKAKIEKLEKSVSAEREAVLRRLHTETGYETRDDLIAALRALGGGGKRGRKPGRPAAAAAGGGKRKKRAVITSELRDNIIAAVKAGGTGSAVAKKFGVSLPTVQNIKRDAGLTKKRKGK